MTITESLLPLLWPPGFETRGTALYAVLDGARDPQIHALVSTGDLAWRSLYSGQLPAALLAVAPHLVELRPNADLTRILLISGWGRAWGIWLVSSAPLDDVRRHLRRFLKVSDERGRQLLFRYYDPIVLTAFLPTCTASELAELFGPIDAFLVESATTRELTELWFDDTALRTRTRALGDD
jgi:hypothetical protein